MKPILTLLVLLTISLSPTYTPTSVNQQQSERLKELDAYWAEVSRTVREGDYEGYSAQYHEDAVVVFATRDPKMSVSISDALAAWKPGFEATRSGKTKANVQFRFSQRIGNKNTAHETGVFAYNDGGPNNYVAFEMLLVKKDGQWLGMMEYQKNQATQADWDALK